MGIDVTIEGYWRWWASRADSVGGRGRRTAAPTSRRSASCWTASRSSGWRARWPRACRRGTRCASRPTATRRSASSPTAGATRRRAADAAFEFHPARIAAPLRTGHGADARRRGVRVRRLPLRRQRRRGRGWSSTSWSRIPRSRELDEQTRATGRLPRARQHPRRGGGRALDRRARVERAGRRAAASARSELRAEVDRLAATAPSGEWAVLRGEDAIVVAARPLRPVDHPYFDELCELKAAVGRARARRAAGPRGGADGAFPRACVPRGEPHAGRRADRVRVRRPRGVDVDRAGRLGLRARLRVQLLSTIPGGTPCGHFR